MAQAITGHAEVGGRLNVRRELSRIRRNPLGRFLELAYRNPDPGGLRARFEEAFLHYTLAMERGLEQVSTAVRFRKGPHYVRKYGGSFGPRQRLVAANYRRLSRFLELDIATCIIQARILLDRTVALSRCFLAGRQLPSFTSFSEHQRFFSKGGDIPGHEEYGEYMRARTSWFDVPIKFARDTLFVHQGPRHFKYFGIPGWGHQDDLVWYFFIPEGDTTMQRPGSVANSVVSLNVLRLSHDIESYLTWFGRYGTRAMKRQDSTP